MSTEDMVLGSLQVLLKPIVSQLGAEPPHSVEDHPDVPSVKEVDDLIVICTGQMAVTAGSDLLWKPLNHEVRLEKICCPPLSFYIDACCACLALMTC